jgi:hypothetical protein
MGVFMDLSNVSDDVLLERTVRYARAERKMTHIVLWHIHEVERRRLYAQLRYESIFKYISQHLGYGEKAAYERMHASRLLGKMPELAAKIEAGTLNLTQVVQVQSCINKEIRAGNKVDQAQTAKIFEKIESLSGEKTLKTLAVEFNQPIQMHEVIQPQRDNTVRAGLIFTDEEMDVMKHVKDLLSHVLPNPTWAELTVYLAKKQIKAIEGNALKKSKVLDLSDKAGVQVKATQRFCATKERKAIKVTTRRQLMENAGKCCEFVNLVSGQRCDGVYQLQVDHKIPVALGGSNDISNLRILCRTHNLLEAKRHGLNWR